MPSLSITVGTRDATACYEHARELVLDLDVSIETGGVTISGTVPAYLSATINGTGATDPSQWHLSWDELCGDVSSSTEWQKYKTPNSGAELCIAAEVQLWSGPTAVSAEVRWKGGSALWGYWNKVATQGRN
jgi:hypothetical protein